MALMGCSFAFFVPIASLIGVGATGMYWASRRKKVLAAEAAGPPAAWMPSAALPVAATSSTAAWAGVPHQGPAAGWYADPSGQARLRWWDGSTWTGNVAS
jgi:hypothetical protein